jgi:hypothetical protein
MQQLAACAPAQLPAQPFVQEFGFEQVVQDVPCTSVALIWYW